MTTIGFIGSGNIGGTVARLAVDAGYDVVVSNWQSPENRLTECLLCITQCRDLRTHVVVI
jgi:predicted dinucleotide-binding enzyme